MNFSPSVTMCRQNPEVTGKWVRPPLFWGLMLVGTIFSFSSNARPTSPTLILGRPQVVGLKRAIKLDGTAELAFSGDRVLGWAGKIVVEIDGSDACRINATKLYCEMVKVISVALCISDHNFEKGGSRGPGEQYKVPG